VELDFDDAYKLMRRKDVHVTMHKFKNKDDIKWKWEIIICEYEDIVNGVLKEDIGTISTILVNEFAANNLLEWCIHSGGIWYMEPRMSCEYISKT